ncbi:MAG: hypothetical protein H5T64_08875 [Chloroflexi bacterium]|nr:hypothetical protein [Chloroflexota bacterium]
MTNSSDYRQIRVGHMVVGMTGLTDIFKSLRDSGRVPTDDLKSELLTLARKHNYIPAAAENEYAEALLREYNAFCRKGEGERAAPQYKPWRGIPREQVPWYPVIHEEQCDGCGKCLKFCSFGVYAWNEAQDKVVVAEPFNCMVGCNACAATCDRDAIFFPPRSMLEGLKK